jgi:hypothetical protein
MASAESPPRSKIEAHAFQLLQLSHFRSAVA